MQRAVPYEQVSARLLPEPVAIAIARDERGCHNPITLCWFMPTSHDPPLVAISIGRTRHSLAALRHARAFVLSIPAAGMGRDAAFHGSHSGRDVDKLAVCGTRTRPATRIDSVLLMEAAANLECVLEAEHEAGDHVVFIGRVVAAHVHADPAVRRLFLLGEERYGGVRPD